MLVESLRVYESVEEEVDRVSQEITSHGLFQEHPFSYLRSSLFGSCRVWSSAVPDRQRLLTLADRRIPLESGWVPAPRNGIPWLLDPRKRLRIRACDHLSWPGAKTPRIQNVSKISPNPRVTTCDTKQTIGNQFLWQNPALAVDLSFEKFLSLIIWQKDHICSDIIIHALKKMHWKTWNEFYRRKFCFCF